VQAKLVGLNCDIISASLKDMPGAYDKAEYEFPHKFSVLLDFWAAWLLLFLMIPLTFPL